MHLSNWNLNIAPKYIHLPKRKKKRNQAALLLSDDTESIWPVAENFTIHLPFLPFLPPHCPISTESVCRRQLWTFLQVRKKTCSPPEKKKKQF